MIQNTSIARIERVDFDNIKHKADLVDMLIDYSTDRMGGGKALDQDIARQSVDMLARHEFATSFLGYVGDAPTGFANCFETVATFAAAPAINIHDLAVSRKYRRQGIAAKLLRAIEEHTKERGGYKMTLEVLEGNVPAQKAYTKAGFRPYQLDPDIGNAMFWQKIITA